MGLYDVEGDVAYVEGKMSEARDYREKQAKKQEKFSKRLQLADWGITGANFILNKKADALEADRITERAWYNTALENSKGWKARYELYQAENLTPQQMFERDVEENLRAALQRDKGAEVNIAGFNNAIRAKAKEWSKGEGRFEAWNKAMQAQLAIPDLTSAQLAERIKNDGAPPRNIASFFGNKLLKVAKSHDSDTLNAAEQKEVDNRLNGILGEKFNSVKTAMAEHRAKGNNIDEFLDWAKGPEGQKIPSYKSTKAEILEDSDEITGITTQSLITIGEKANGVWEPVGDTAPTVITTTRTKVPAKVYTNSQISLAKDKINTFVTDSGTDAVRERWNNLIEKDAESGLGSGTAGESENILRASEYLQANYNTDPAKAIQIAAEYVLGNPEKYGATTPNSWDVAQITGEVDDDAFGMYLEDIISTRKGLNRQVETSQLASRLILTIKSNDSYDEDTKAEKIAEINKLLEATKDKTGIGALDDSKIVFNITPEETIEDTYSQLDIEKGVPEQDTLVKNHNKLHDSLLALTYQLQSSDKSKMSGTEYKQAEQKIINNSIKIKQFKEKFGISFDEVLKTLQKEKSYYRKAMASMGAAAEYSPFSPAEVYKTYDNDTLAEMLAFMYL
jgi:hypothetical protein